MSEAKDDHIPENTASTDAEHRIRLLEQELAQARKFEEIGMLAGVVAHDLNNILTPVFGYATILRRDLDTDHPLSKAVGVIEKSAERAALLIGKLLGCSRQQDADVRPFYVAETIGNILQEVEERVPAIEKSCPQDLPQVLGDPHQMEVVLRAVAENAIEAIGEGGMISVTLEKVVIDDNFCRRHPPAKSGPHVCISIVDTGKGMSADVLEHVFEPFYSTKPSTLNAGTGLTLVRSLLKRCRGAVDLESCEGRGTTVKIYLPVADS